MNAGHMVGLERIITCVTLINIYILNPLVNGYLCEVDGIHVRRYPYMLLNYVKYINILRYFKLS